MCNKGSLISHWVRLILSPYVLNKGKRLIYAGLCEVYGLFYVHIMWQEQKVQKESAFGVFLSFKKKKTNGAPKDDLASLLKKDHQNYFFFFLLRYAVTINTRKMYYSTWLNESIVLITLTFKNVRISEESLLYYQQPQIPNIYHFYLENEFFKVAN